VGFAYLFFFFFFNQRLFIDFRFKEHHNHRLPITSAIKNKTTLKDRATEDENTPVFKKLRYVPTVTAPVLPLQ